MSHPQGLRACLNYFFRWSQNQRTATTITVMKPAAITNWPSGLDSPVGSAWRSSTPVSLVRTPARDARHVGRTPARWCETCSGRFYCGPLIFGDDRVRTSSQGRCERPVGLVVMRHTAFRRRMAEEFGEIRAEMLAQDHVMAELGGRTVDQALDAGLFPKEVWHAVCDTFDIPAERR
ncbi:hypothetical protein GCM10027563_10480 [Parasphingorhabdus pacifica]